MFFFFTLAVLALVGVLALLVVLFAAFAWRRGARSGRHSLPTQLEADEATPEQIPQAGRALPAKSAILRQVHDSEIEAQIRSGHLLDAIKLYREKTGVGLKEAQDAVAAWRHRIRAS